MEGFTASNTGIVPPNDPRTDPNVWVEAFGDAFYSKPVTDRKDDHSGCMRALKFVSAATIIAVLLK